MSQIPTMEAEREHRRQIRGEAEPPQPGARVLRSRNDGMFSDVWFWLVGIFILIGALTKESGFMALGACLFTVIPVSWLWNRYALRNLEYRRRFDRQRVFPGETVTMALELTNRKFLPLSWVRCEDEFPLSLDPAEISLTPHPSSENSGYLRSAFTVRWYQRVRRVYHLHCQSRGHYVVGPVKIESGDIFTLFTSQEERLLRDTVIVYPQVYPLQELGFTTQAPFGNLRIRQSLIQDPTLTRGIRDYRPEDSFRHVHWKASARRGELQTRVYQPTTDVNLVVALNVTTMPKVWLGVRPDLLERAVVVAASIANHAAEQKWSLGLISNGVPRSDQAVKVLPGRSPDQLAHVLEALAAVTSFATSSIEVLLRVESPRIPLGATLVLVTAVVNEEMLATLLQLREAGRRVVLVSLADEAPPGDLPGILVHHLPTDAQAFVEMGNQVYGGDGSLAAIPVPQPVLRPNGGVL